MDLHEFFRHSTVATNREIIKMMSKVAGNSDMTSRRAFIRNAIVTGIGSSTALASVAIARRHEIGDNAKELGQQTIKKISNKMEDLEARVDKMEHHHQNLLRVGAIGFVLSTGIDITLLF